MVKTTKRDLKSYFWCVKKNKEGLGWLLCLWIPWEGKCSLDQKEEKRKSRHRYEVSEATMDREILRNSKFLFPTKRSHWYLSQHLSVMLEETCQQETGPTGKKRRSVLPTLSLLRLRTARVRTTGVRFHRRPLTYQHPNNLSALSHGVTGEQMGRYCGWQVTKPRALGQICHRFVLLAYTVLMFLFC